MRQCTPLKQTNYGKLLRKIRQKKGMSIRRLAKHIGVNPSYLSRIECNKVASPTWARMTAIAEALDSPDLMEGRIVHYRAEALTADQVLVFRLCSERDEAKEWLRQQEAAGARVTRIITLIPAEPYTEIWPWRE